MLEEQLQTMLLHRTTRHMSLTDAGERYYRRAKKILAERDEANCEARMALTLPEGRIRIHSLPGLAQSHVTAAIVAYQAANPGVCVELKIESRLPNLVEDGYDVSLMTSSHLDDSGYVTRVLGSSYCILAASPDYLERHGTPLTKDDLADHSLLRLDSPLAPPDEWHLEGPQGNFLFTVSRSPFQVNAPEALRYALRSGAGIGALTTYSAIEDLRSGKLVRVLPEYRIRSFKVYAVYASRQYLDAKVRTLLEHLHGTLSPVLDELEQEIETLIHPQLMRAAQRWSRAAMASGMVKGSRADTAGPNRKNDP